MNNQPYVGRIALCTRKKLLKSGEIRAFYSISIPCNFVLKRMPGINLNFGHRNVSFKPILANTAPLTFAESYERFDVTLIT